MAFDVWRGISAISLRRVPAPKATPQPQCSLKINFKFSFRSEYGSARSPRDSLSENGDEFSLLREFTFIFEMYFFTV